MLRVLAAAAVLAAGGFSGLVREGSAAESSHQPRIKFLDDVVSWGRVSAGDPWEERIETERHDFTQSATTVGRGVSQMEMGYTYFCRDEQGEIEQSHTTPEIMLRLGLTDDIEFAYGGVAIGGSLVKATTSIPPRICGGRSS